MPTKPRLYRVPNFIATTEADILIPPGPEPIVVPAGQIAPTLIYNASPNVYKRPVPLPPLTVQWFRSMLTPRFTGDGSPLYVLTPPRYKGSDFRLGSWLRVALVLAPIIYAAWYCAAYLLRG